MGARVFGAKFLIPALLLAGLAASGTMQVTSQAVAATNPIVTENQQPGTGAWLIGSLQADDVNGQIKGYASATQGCRERHRQVAGPPTRPPVCSPASGPRASP